MTKLTVKRETGLTVQKATTKARRPKPSFPSLLGEHPAEVAPNPLDALDEADDLEADATARMEAMSEHLRAEKKVKRDAYRVMLDHEYWLCLCFQSRAQKEEFLEKAGWFDMGDKYMDGLAVARHLKIDVEPIPLAAKSPPRAPKSLREEVLNDA